MASGIVYRSANLPALLVPADTDYDLSVTLSITLIVIYMVYGIAQIIGEYFFYLELITPRLDRLRAIIDKRCSLLVGEYSGGRYLALDQFTQIKADHLHCVRTEFKLVKGKEFPDKRIHFLGFINDHFQIIIPGFRIVCHAVLQSFRIPLNQGKRRL